MDYTAEERAIIWLCACTDFDDRARVALLRAAKDPANLMRMEENFFRRVINGNLRGIYKNNGERESELGKALSRLEENGFFAVTLASSDYPESLKAIPDPPLMLYGAGRRELLQKRKFCIVGSRITPAWAEKHGRSVSETLSERFAIVTGLAEGGDSAAIAGALSGGNLICVLPNGLDECYPAAHASLKARVRERGLLLSEYPLGTKVKKYSFHARNRLLAGLSEGVLVISAGQKSGALITANFALDYGRDVFAFPYNLGAAQGAGCNELIKKGAYLASGAEDILSCYGIEPKAKAETPLSSEEERVLRILRENGELHTVAIAERAGLRTHEAAAILSALELKNLAAKAGGNRYAAI